MTQESTSTWKAKPDTWNNLRDAARHNRRTPTPAEAILWSHLRAGRLEGLKFRRQHAIGPYIVDFYCPAARLIIEIDGPIHLQFQDQDAERTRFLHAMNHQVIRFSNSQVLDTTGEVIETIARAARSK